MPEHPDEPVRHVSPLAQSAYDVLDVAPSASEEELRRAFRLALRLTHPDTGGDPLRFSAVQLAWEQVRTVQRRAAYDAGHVVPGQATASARPTFTAPPTRAHTGDRPRSRAYGHPGGWRRQKYLAQSREWVGRGRDITDPYDAALVRGLPREIRRTLADALAEEATARTLVGMGIGFTVWHDVATGSPANPERKIDHVVLGPTGLFALLSEDFGDAVRVRRGELIGDALAGERPVHELVSRARSFSRGLRVRFTAVMIVLPDDALGEVLMPLGASRGTPALAVTQSALAPLLRRGIDGVAPIGGNELFETRSRLTAGIRFV